MSKPAPTIGATDSRCDVKMEQNGCRCRGCMRWRMESVPALLNAYTAQAAQLAAMMPMVEALAHWPLGCPEFVVALRDLRALVGAGAAGEGRADGG